MLPPVLIVEDDTKLARIVKAYLEGADFRTVHASTVADALQKAEAELPLAAILDLGLPDGSGEELCQSFKELGDFPVIMLTAKSSEEERIAGFALGADDYMVKPASPRELVCRLKAVLKRYDRSFNSMAHSLEAQEKLRRTLLSNAAHELRTPLAIIAGELEGMLDGVLPTDRSALQSLHDEARRLTAILDGVDELSRAEAGVLDLHKETFELKQYLATIVARFERLFADKHAVLLLDCPDNLRINADPDRLSQILINLISNSIKAVASGGRVTIVACSDGDRVCLEIRDNGYGIPEDDLPHIFERFYKGKNGGLGLGLAIVQELVAAHGGTVSVRSTAGSGTSFCMKLP